MPLMIGSGDIKPYIRWGVRENLWQYSSAEGPVEFDIEAEPFVLDIQGLALGWLKIDAGREWLEWPSLYEPLADPNPQNAPIKEWKRGFAVELMSRKLWGEETVREFSSNAAGALAFATGVYNMCEKDHLDDLMSGKCPVIRITGAPSKKVGMGTTRDIQFTIEKMIDRPSEFTRVAVEIRNPKGSAQPAPTPKQETAPAAKPVESDEEF